MTIFEANPERRNLLVMSLSFIVYFLAGGKFEGGSVKLYVINVTFEHSIVLSFFAWFLLIWFAWRYWLTFRNEYRKISDTELQKNSNNFISRAYVSNKTGLEYKKIGGFLRCIVSPHNHNELSISVIENATYDENGQLTNIRQGESQTVVFKGFFGWSTKFSIYLMTLLNEKGMSTIYTPYILFILAVLLGLWRWFSKCAF